MTTTTSAAVKATQEDSGSTPRTNSATLIRPVFTKSRLLDFCNVKDLTAQTGHTPDEWPLVIVKELIDNALDVCEEHGIAPQITIGIEPDSLTVADNGPGLAASTIAKIPDYNVTASSREAFVAPTMGAQGNALKTIVAMPYALSGTTGTTTIEAHRVRHTITFRADQIRQEPVVEIATDRSFVKNGTRITVQWPSTPRLENRSLKASKAKILQIADTYRVTNPHLDLTITVEGKPSERAKASNGQWQHWQPSSPAPAHWYEQDTIERLIAAHVRDGQDRGQDMLVREFVATFRGLSGSAKQKSVLNAAGAARMTLADFFGSGSSVNREGVANLLAAMKAESRPPKPSDLGVIGEDHMAAYLKDQGALLDSIRYKKIVHDNDVRPFVIEAAFAWCPDNISNRRQAIGLNFSPAIRNPI
jgi:DNA topoisomerase VI subunit B